MNAQLKDVKSMFAQFGLEMLKLLAQCSVFCDHVSRRVVLFPGIQAYSGLLRQLALCEAYGEFG